MTAVAPTLQAAFTPPASSHGKKVIGRDDWEFSVPIDVSDGDVPRNKKSIVASPVKSDFHISSSAHTNGFHDYDRTATQSEENRHYSDYLHAPGNGRSKHDSMVSSHQDGDSVLDLYNGRLSMISAISGEASTSEGSPPFGNSAFPKTPEPTEDETKWIHRDKLAQIEGNEAADYLYDVGQSRWIHKDKLERIEIEELQRGGELDLSRPSTTRDGDKSSYLLSRPDTSNDEEEPILDANFHEIRTLEEQAADEEAEARRRSFRRNRSYSRIPLAAVSPHPIPQQFIERDKPLPRSSVTPNGSDDGTGFPSIAHPSLRKRSYSAGSAQLLHDDRDPPPGTPNTLNPKSPNRSSVLSSVSSPRKLASRAGSMQGKPHPYTRSNPQLHRPGTSHSSFSTSTGKHVDLDGQQPPWALQGYKPDPSLPQDQQIIPTLAKKLQQEQWERDGVYATVYDKELRPLKVEKKEDEEQQERGEEWPLKSGGAEQEDVNRVVTEQAAENEVDQKQGGSGGYKIVPNITPSANAAATSSQSPQVKQMQPENEGKKKKKFSCCVIM
ncbi:hypothetical protein BZA77DRAFT_293143 [Pyronema omphalodes]|nr:hypothetical protein BZA77DRAFT_293143 [Pyronema omphalodes]